MPPGWVRAFYTTWPCEKTGTCCLPSKTNSLGQCLKKQDCYDPVSGSLDQIATMIALKNEGISLGDKLGDEIEQNG